MTANVTRRDIVQGLDKLGLQGGDTVLVHSSLSSFGIVEGGAHTVIDALMHVVGIEGILAMPTHTWGTVNAGQPVFHARLSPSIVGQITEEFRHRPGVIRSLHPTHSVAATGRKAAEFLEGHERWSTPCSPDSPYGRLVAAGGNVLLLGPSLNSLTLMHGFEEWAEVPWLFNRVEKLYTVLDTGQVLTVRSQRHSDKEGLHRDYPAFEPILREHSLIHSTSIGNSTIRLVSAKGAAELLVPLLKHQPDLPLAERSVPVPNR